jgi:uncharacterized phage protein (TIGR01671 family)
MFEVHCFTAEEVFENTFDGVGTSHTNPANMNDCVLMQCSGLKDKNGRLIYEGDIIAVANGSINGNVCISKWEVVWIENEGRYSVPFWVADKPNFSHYVKVLGNVHENPELLEDK